MAEKKKEVIETEHIPYNEELRAKLSEEQIRDCFNYDYYTKNVDAIFKRVFK